MNAYQCDQFEICACLKIFFRISRYLPMYCGLRNRRLNPVDCALKFM